MNDITELGLLSAIIRNCSLLEELIHSTPLTDSDKEIIEQLSKARKQFSQMHATYIERRQRVQEQRVTDLKRAINESGLKQYEVADAAGITSSYLSMILNGHKPLTDELNDKILNTIKP